VTGSATLVVGYVSRAHGISGEVAVRMFDAASDALDGVERLVLRSRDGEEREFTVLEARPASKEVLLTLDSVVGRSAAEALRGSTVLVHREDLSPPSDGEYFQGDLVGLKAVSPEGEALGTVEEVWNAGPVPTLVIRGGAGEVLVPFADDFVSTVDLEKGVIQVRPMEFL
jgi:16S rRNA processing protein RimM